MYKTKKHYSYLLRKFDCFFLTNQTKTRERMRASKNQAYKNAKKKSATFLHYRLLQKRTHTHMLELEREKRKIVSTKHQPKIKTETKDKNGYI